MSPHAAPAIAIQDAGASSHIGSRQAQQDKYTLLLPPDFPTKSPDELAFFAVYDGHGSSMVSSHANENIRRFLQESEELGAGRYEEAIREVILREERALLEGFSGGEEKFSTTGSTAAMALVNLTRGFMVVGNLGDSGVLIGDYDYSGNGLDEGEEAGNIRCSTKAHKPGDSSEKARIVDAGGRVNTDSGSERIGTLNMSRALGDLQYKEPLINSGTGPLNEAQERACISSSIEQQNLLSNEPFVTQVNLNDGSQHVVVLATDGVTDALTDDAIINGILMCYRSGLSATESSEDMAGTAASLPGSDNATCIAVFIDGTS
ncbi:hypothetical protein ETB97_012012 [Aspergillus alliaceus]|uniref:protein-serine/threonine phosphatase n=1 Tax=Petromyces alliaceus TaxID=209559 RepID=A0A5N6G9V9_PETAA|nr:phosphatase 2C-like domain-containing protein [Aspergillus alliaceus]KAB8239206.1 phosphatase 2C-like domain-containing protein [Aspergillus alliaceus]KAE8395734.1 phosphatase 2C-like domain-containing protein [Aspergillus alliaceus]KAF5866460.1 hypothetical protein ETB97_012012 [Aspergillus burnettii]